MTNEHPSVGAAGRKRENGQGEAHDQREDKRTFFHSGSPFWFLFIATDQNDPKSNAFQKAGAPGTVPLAFVCRDIALDCFFRKTVTSGNASSLHIIYTIFLLCAQ